jgi:hypothetical protein
MAFRGGDPTARSESAILLESMQAGFAVSPPLA